MLFGINIVSISILQGTEDGKVSEVLMWLATLIIRSMEVLSVFPPIEISS